jgi:hypothetical protein
MVPSLEEEEGGARRPAPKGGKGCAAPSPKRRMGARRLPQMGQDLARRQHPGGRSAATCIAAPACTLMVAMVCATEGWARGPALGQT